VTENAITRNFLDLLLDADPELREKMLQAVQPFRVNQQLLARISPAFQKFTPEFLTAATSNFDVAVLQNYTQELFAKGVRPDPALTDRLVELLDDETELEHVLDDASSPDYVREAYDGLRKDLVSGDADANRGGGAITSGHAVYLETGDRPSEPPLIPDSHVRFATIYGVMLGVATVVLGPVPAAVSTAMVAQLAYVLALATYRRLFGQG
jgi:hypothetical protein